MPFEDPRSLASVGLRPEGTGPSPFETVIGGASKFVDTYFEEQEKETKKAKDNLDMYVTLRKAGYSSDQAADAIRKKKITGAPVVDTYGAAAEVAGMAPEKERLAQEETRATIKEKEAKALKDTSYANSYGNDIYEDPEDIPPTKGGLPQESVTYIPGKGYKVVWKKTKKTQAEQNEETLAEWNAEADAKKDAKSIADTEKKPTGNFFENMIAKFQKPSPVKSTQPKVSTAATETPAAEPMVRVINPAGKLVQIKSSQLAAALKKGYTKE